MNDCKPLLRILLKKLSVRTYVKKMAYLLKSIISDAPVTLFIPFRYLENISARVPDLLLKRHVSKHLSFLRDIIPEFANLIEQSLKEYMEVLTLDFLLYLVEFTTNIHENDLEVKR